MKTVKFFFLIRAMVENTFFFGYYFINAVVGESRGPLNLLHISPLSSFIVDVFVLLLHISTEAVDGGL